MAPVVKKDKLVLYSITALVYLTILLLSGYRKNEPDFVIRASNDAWRVPYVTATVFMFFELVLPALQRKRWLRSAGLIILQGFLFSWGLYFWRQLGVLLHLYTPLRHYTNTARTVEAETTFTMMSLVFFAIVVHLYNHVRLRAAAQELRIRKQEAELNYLKAQTNPHFLFNTLNNIFSLIRTGRSELASESVLKLSKLLRFMLYESSADFIAVQSEVRIINDFIALQKLRFRSTLSIDFSSEVDNPEHPIAPLLLTPLVENAFKHGVSETIANPYININLVVKEAVLHMQVSNSVGEGHIGTIKENIGLTNLRKQLQLLYSEYTLSITPEKERFTVDLHLNLNSHVKA